MEIPLFSVETPLQLSSERYKVDRNIGRQTVASYGTTPALLPCQEINIKNVTNN